MGTIILLDHYAATHHYSWRLLCSFLLICSSYSVANYETFEIFAEKAKLKVVPTREEVKANDCMTPVVKAIPEQLETILVWVQAIFST